MSGTAAAFTLNKYCRGSPGTLVPRATIVIEVTLSFKCEKQPNCEATSPMTAVITPIPHIETMNEGQPPPLSAHVCMGGVVVQGGATHMTQTQIKTENKEQEEKKEHRKCWLVLF